MTYTKLYSWCQRCMVMLCLVVMDANGELTFSEVNGAETYCDSSPGRGRVSDAATCLSAVESLATDVTRTYALYETFSDTDPPGCSYQTDSGSTFNHNFASTADCSSRSCACVSAPDCSKTNGDAPNSAPCLCGNAGCSKATWKGDVKSGSGLRCYKSINTCGDGPLCSNTNGTKINDATCQCGTNECIFESTPGDVENSKSDTGWSSGSSGKYCKSSTSECSYIPICSQTNGLLPNTQTSCQCGSTACTEDTGIFCDSELKIGDDIGSSVASTDITSQTGEDLAHLPIQVRWGAPSGTCSSKPILKCTHTDGKKKNEQTCVCGIGEYLHSQNETLLMAELDRSYAGYGQGHGSCGCNAGSYCTNPLGYCTALDTCLITDGALPNSQDCSCFAEECITDGLVCDAASKSCAQGDCGDDAGSNETMPNCEKFNPRCQCAKCKAGFYSEDCSAICPSPAVSIILDSIFVFVSTWSLFAYLYYTHRHITPSEIDAHDAVVDTKGDVEETQELVGEVLDTEAASKLASTVSKELMAQLEPLSRQIRCVLLIFCVMTKFVSTFYLFFSFSF